MLTASDVPSTGALKALTSTNAAPSRPPLSSHHGIGPVRCTRGRLRRTTTTSPTVPTRKDTSAAASAEPIAWPSRPLTAIWIAPSVPASTATTHSKGCGRCAATGEVSGAGRPARFTIAAPTTTSTAPSARSRLSGRTSVSNAPAMSITRPPNTCPTSGSTTVADAPMRGISTMFMVRKIRPQTPPIQIHHGWPAAVAAHGIGVPVTSTSRPRPAEPMANEIREAGKIAPSRTASRELIAVWNGIRAPATAPRNRARRTRFTADRAPRRVPGSASEPASGRGCRRRGRAAWRSDPSRGRGSASW